MVICIKKGDVLRGDKVVCESRKISSIKVINKSGRHKANKITLRDNVNCVIDKELKFIK